MSYVLTAAGSTPWQRLDVRQNPFNVGFSVVLSSGASMTYTVQHTFDSVQTGDAINCTVTRSGTTATLVFPANHRLSAGDSLVVISGPSPFTGTYAIASVTNATTVTYTVASSGATAATVKVLPLRVFAHEFVAAKTASDDGNYGAPCSACRLTITSFSSGEAEFTVLQGPD